jgi:site-specific DNA-cytosine methylase
MKKVILHLCADIGSDSRPYQLDDDYEVILIGEKIGVENYYPDRKIHGIIANPVCTEFSTAKGFHKDNDIKKGMLLVTHCIRIIMSSNPVWHVMENPATGKLTDVIGKPDAVYQP